MPVPSNTIIMTPAPCSAHHPTPPSKPVSSCNAHLVQCSPTSAQPPKHDIEVPPECSEHADWLQARRNFRSAAIRLIIAQHDPSVASCRTGRELLCALHRRHVEAGLLFQLAALRFVEVTQGTSDAPDMSHSGVGSTSKASRNTPVESIRELDGVTTLEEVELLACATTMNRKLLGLQSDAVDMMRKLMDAEGDALDKRYLALGGDVTS